MQMTVSIIIVNFNTRQLTTNCIRSIYEKTTGITFEII
jgi:GT2 family glycosyltransferase